MKLQITIDDKIITLDGIDSCIKIPSLPGGRQVYGAYSSSQEENPTYAYFDIGMEESQYIYKIAGKVELIDIPVTETLLNTWEKETKK